MIDILKNVLVVFGTIALAVIVIIVGYVAGIVISVALVLVGGYFLVSEYRKSKSEIVDEVKSE